MKKLISGLEKKELKTLYVKNREVWREWLRKNHKKSPGIWLIYYKKSSKKPRVPYGDAVEEALCFGWIDSTVKKMDDERFMQRFTPRKPKSGWSGLNKARINKMILAGLMTDAGFEKIEAAKKDGSWESLDEIYVPENQLKIPAALNEAFFKNKKAKLNFENFPVFTKRQFLHWINSAKRPQSKNARIKLAIKMCIANKKPGVRGFKI